MNALDYLVLLATLGGIAGYGMWRTRGQRDLRTYLKGRGDTGWLTIGLSVMATQASAITFLSVPGQGYRDGLGFVQNYFGAPFALIVISVVFLPLYRRLNVYTAYEYLGRRFDAKTRLLGAGFFLLQRGLGAGITIYAPAIVLATVMGWRLDLTIIGSGLLAVVYTVAGGNEAVNITQKQQLAVIFVGMAAAGIILVARLPKEVSFADALAVAGNSGRLHAVDFSLDPNRRYTFWSGLLGGMFLALSYFGTDQSQVGRYLSGASLRESRLGLMFNAVCKIPMQFLILGLGVMAWAFYQFDTPPVFFNQTAWTEQLARAGGDKLRMLEANFIAAHDGERQQVLRWLAARRLGNQPATEAARQQVATARGQVETIRAEAANALHAADPQVSVNDGDFVFITFILKYLPHGLIGLLIAAFFAAALSSKAGELNALGSTTTVDFYRHLQPRTHHDGHYVQASRWFTAGWGIVAIGFALFAHLSENLIQAVNILGSIFNGVVLGLFLVAFFLRRVGGTAVFWGAVTAQTVVIVLYCSLSISYLWYNVIGCAACMLISLLIQEFAGGGKLPARETTNP